MVKGRKLSFFASSRENKQGAINRAPTRADDFFGSFKFKWVAKQSHPENSHAKARRREETISKWIGVSSVQ